MCIKCIFQTPNGWCLAFFLDHKQLSFPQKSVGRNAKNTKPESSDVGGIMLRCTAHLFYILPQGCLSKRETARNLRVLGNFFEHLTSFVIKLVIKVLTTFSICFVVLGSR